MFVCAPREISGLNFLRTYPCQPIWSFVVQITFSTHHSVARASRSSILVIAVGFGADLFLVETDSLVENKMNVMNKLSCYFGFRFRFFGSRGGPARPRRGGVQVIQITRYQLVVKIRVGKPYKS